MTEGGSVTFALFTDLSVSPPCHVAQNRSPEDRSARYSSGRRSTAPLSRVLVGCLVISATSARRGRYSPTGVPSHLSLSWVLSPVFPVGEGLAADDKLAGGGRHPSDSPQPRRHGAFFLRPGALKEAGIGLEWTTRDEDEWGWTRFRTIRLRLFHSSNSDEPQRWRTQVQGGVKLYSDNPWGQTSKTIRSPAANPGVRSCETGIGACNPGLTRSSKAASVDRDGVVLGSHAGRAAGPPAMEDPNRDG